MPAENPPHIIWDTVINAMSAIVETEDVQNLRACQLEKSNGKWYVSAPNKYAIDLIEKSGLWPIVTKTLSKQGINKATLREEIPDLFTHSEKKAQKKSVDREIKSKLDPEYQFDSFVEGESNTTAFNAAKRISEGLFSDEFNPLLIYGGTGLGKSHLMHAIGNTLVAKGKKRVLYLTAEEFSNDFIRTIREADRSMTEFNDYYRSADALLIDDIQFFVGKDRSQAEFFHTFNSLFSRSCQIVLTSDKLPKEIPEMEPRLRSRFGSGLSVSVEPPGFETRVAILQRKAEKLKFNLPMQTAQFIAENIASNVRELEGALRKVYAMYSFSEKKEDVSVEFARNALKDLLTAQNKQISLANIRKVVAAHFGITLTDLDSESRKASVRLPRQTAMSLVRELTNLSTTDIGKAFGGRDHSTVINSCKRISTMLEKDEKFNEIYKGLKLTIMG